MVQRIALEELITSLRGEIPYAHPTSYQKKYKLMKELTENKVIEKIFDKCLSDLKVENDLFVVNALNYFILKMYKHTIASPVFLLFSFNSYLHSATSSNNDEKSYTEKNLHIGLCKFL